jgi:nucleoside-diphosphate-sugar epimerase
MTRVLITGSGGYIGQVLVPLARAHGWDVTGLDSGYFEGCDVPGMEVAVPDVFNDVRDVTPEDLRGFDAIVHLAGLSNDPLGELNPGLTSEINYEASVRLAAAAKEAGVQRFVFSSSCSVYGARSSRPVTEEDELEPLTAYAASKVETERAVSKLASRDFCPIYLRNATVYGLSPRLRFDLVVNNLAGWAHTTGVIRIMSDGSPWRPLIHVADVSKAFIAAVEAPADAVWNQSFNIGADRDNYTVKDIATLVNEAYPECRVSYSDSPPADSRSYRVDFSKAARTLTAFQPTWTLAAGIAELRDNLRAINLTAEDFQGPKYTRLKHIQALQSQGLLDANLRRALAAAS